MVSYVLFKVIDKIFNKRFKNKKVKNVAKIKRRKKTFFTFMV